MGPPVLLTDDASRDLEALCDYIDRHDGRGEADHVLDRIEATFTSVTENPERGACPRELLSLGLRDFSESFVKL